MYAVCGLLVDDETRCEHWHSAKDIIALKFKCCPNKYYACHSCHVETNDASHIKIKYHVETDKDVKVVLCGHCKTELTFAEYQSKSTHDSLKCPCCGSEFNPGCRLHYSDYFAGVATHGSVCELGSGKS